MDQITLGEMHIAGQPPDRLAAALRIVSAKLHPLIDTKSRPGSSKGCCILCSLIVRDALIWSGIAANVASVVTIAKSRLGARAYVKIIGSEDRNPRPKEWSGHMVVIADGYLIDTTLYRLPQPPLWHGPRGMFALPLIQSEKQISGRKLLTGLSTKREGMEHELYWLDNNSNDTWRQYPDGRDDGHVANLRTAVAAKLIMPSVAQP